VVSVISPLPASLSEIDQRRFGVVTAKALCTNAREVLSAVNDSKCLSARLLILRVPSSSWPCVTAAQRAGGLLTDVLDHYAWSAQEVPRDDGPGAEGASLIGLGGPDVAAEVADVATAAFACYESHYHRDPKLDPLSATAIYPDWATTACRLSSSLAPVLTQRLDGRLIGFAALRRPEPQTYNVALFAIAPAHQRGGHGLGLIRAVQALALSTGATAVTYSTQVENFSARRLVARAGFAPTYAFLTFHVWNHA
jgi:GNAT superfamily N-acetyltransferase